MSSPAPRTANPLAVPPWLYNAVYRLSVFMVIWMAVFPATWLAGFVPKYADGILTLLEADSATPDEILTKYKGHRLIVSLHQLPSILWSIGMPLQFNATLRACNPSLHRWIGRITALSALILSVGVAAIIKAGMLADVPGAWVFPWGAVWFVICLLLGVWNAWGRKYVMHRAWMIRHFAAGSWIIFMRLILGVVKVGMVVGLVPALANDQKIVLFFIVARVSAAIAIGGAEALLALEGRGVSKGEGVKTA